jgi:hypothetical protein
MPDLETAIVDSPVSTEVSTPVVETPEVEPVETTETPVTETGREEAAPQKPEEKREEVDKDDLSEFAPSISARLREMTKKAPELDAVLKKYPDLRNSFEATFRRDAAYREIFPTVAEARQLREVFPNGLGDAQELLQELNEVGELDNNLVARDPEGRYPGHSKIIRDIFAQDRNAAIALLENSTREWSREDPESYDRIFSGIMGATFKSQGVVNHIAQLQALAKQSDNPNLQQMIDQLADWVNGFAGEQRTKQLSPEAERLRNERQAFDREREERQRADGEAFSKNFVSESTRLQKQIVETHPLIKRLPQAIPAQKRERIVNEVMVRMRDHLQKSPSFMRSLKAAYQNLNLPGTLDIQRKVWNQPWLLNMYVRKVLAEETPGIVQATRPVARATGTNRTSTQTAATGRNGPAHTAPYHEGGRWYKPNGQPMTTEEVLRLG